MMKYDAVIAGYTCVDLIPDFKKGGLSTNLSDILIPGKLIEIEGLHYVLGGAVPNTGLAMKKFNKKVFLNGLIGDDFIGKIAKEKLGKYGISEGIAITDQAGTAFSIVIAPPGVDRIFLESPGCNQILNEDNINFSAVSQSRLFHFGYPPLLKQFFLNGGSQLFRMYSKVKQMGVITSLDFSLPDPESDSGKLAWPSIMKKTLPFVDIFVPSLDEALLIMMPDKYSEIKSLAGNANIIDKIPMSLIKEVGKKIIDTGIKILLLKSAAQGAYLLTGDISQINRKLDLKLDEKDWSFRELWSKAYPAEDARIVNTSGAGDTAAAAFLSAILNGETAESALKYATIAGRNNLYCKDLFSDLADWEMMTKEIRTVPHDIINLKEIK
jgi:sugar/nucleoside kinase (ribokinase family)